MNELVFYEDTGGNRSSVAEDKHGTFEYKYIRADHPVLVDVLRALKSQSINERGQATLCLEAYKQLNELME